MFLENVKKILEIIRQGKGIFMRKHSNTYQNVLKMQ